MDVNDFWSVAFPSYLTGVGTLGLAAFALLTIRSDRREKTRLRDEAVAAHTAEAAANDAREREGRLAAERAQAEQVVVWSDLIARGEPGFPLGATVFVGGKWVCAVVQNGSALPITDVQVTWCYLEGTGKHSPIQILPVVPPQSSRQASRDISLQSQPILPIEITFVDAAGRRWRRDRVGALGRI